MEDVKEVPSKAGGRVSVCVHKIFEAMTHSHQQNVNLMACLLSSMVLARKTKSFRRHACSDGQPRLDTRVCKSIQECARVCKSIQEY